MPPLPREFYARDTRVVARELLGKVLVAGERRARIVETEAYHGIDDAASHGHGGPTPRSAIMYGPAGFAYVYLIYGVWNCLNIVTGDAGFPAAVLIRAAHVEGDPDPRAAAGPGKLCRALAIDRTWNGEDVVAGTRLHVVDEGPAIGPIRTGPRIGVDYAGDWAARPWRFWLGRDPSISRKEKADARAPSPRRRRS
jgi:DNA-3-methyladenine glycosylase